MQPTRFSPDVTAVKALAHPVRMRMLGLLRLDGPSTATHLAERLDLNSGATSYHLRQLEKYGFITEDTERGNKRERWWRATHDYTSVDAGDDDATRDASDAFAQAVATTNSQELQRAVEERTELPDAWRGASLSSDLTLCVTPEQASRITARLLEVLWDEFTDIYPARPADADPNARQYRVQVHAFPRPGHAIEADAREKDD